MLVLALDTSTSRGSLALLRGQQLLAEFILESPASYLNRLLAGIDYLLQATGASVGEVNLIVVGQGPGNFTGLRLGLATAKGLALAVGCPVIAVNTLDVLAAGLPFVSLPVCPVIDAKKQEVYAAFYDCRTGTARRQSDYLLLKPDAVAAQILEPTLITGPGLERYETFFRDSLGGLAVFPPPEGRHVRAGVLGRLGLEEFAAGRIPDLDRLAPFYLRPADAELQKPPASLQQP